MQSVFENDTQAVKHALESGMTLNWETETGFSPLSLAMSAGYVDLAILFLNRGATMPEEALRHLACFMWTPPLIKAIVKSQGGNHFGKIELGFAISYGAPEAVLDFLIESAAMERSEDYSKAGIFFALSRSRIYSSRAQIREMAHRLLNAGFVPAQKEYQIEEYHASFAELFRKAEDSSLIRRFEFWDPHFPAPAPSQGDLNEKLSEVNSLEEADSLLRLGADPAAPLGRCTSGNGTDRSSPLSVRISKDCQSNPAIPYSALDWQLAGLFLQHSPQRVSYRINKRDSLFIFAVSGNPARLKSFVESFEQKNFVVDFRTSDSNQALSFAAQAGDSAITAFLLDFPFSAKDKELALRSAISGGSAAAVKLLLEKGAGARISSTGEAGLANLFELLFERWRKLSDASDTIIAKSLLSAYRQASSPFKDTTLYPLSLAKLMPNRRKHLVLMDFLFRQIAGPLDPVEFYKNLVCNEDILQDTVTMRRVVTEGYESKILGVILQSFYDSQKDGPVNNPEKMRFILNQLNGFIEKGVNLGEGLKGLDPDWVRTLGKYQIKYDQKQNRFALTWRIPSLYAQEGDFNAPEQGRSLDYRW